MKTKHPCRRLLALLLTLVMTISMFTASALAANPSAYRDPAEHWMNAGSRTNILDANSVLTHETFYCFSCGQHTSFSVWRCPEYTKDGQTALARNIRYSDGTSADGKSTGILMDLEPDKGGIWTHYHWTKSMCDTCGCINSNSSVNHYDFGKDLYGLYDCAGEFYEDLEDQVTYENVDGTYHTKTVEGGYYCEFCFGTEHTHSEKLEKHSLKTTIVPEQGNQRFAVTKSCANCDYSSTEYVAAKAVVTDYYGPADGQAHTLLVSDLSESGVSAKIRYGNSAADCTLVTPPSYTDPGQYSVYYQVTYSYQGQSMTENGVAYVWLLDQSTRDPGNNTTVIYHGHTTNVTPTSPEHNYTLLETVAPTCTEMGYTRYL